MNATDTIEVQAALQLLESSTDAWTATGDEQRGGWVLNGPQSHPCTQTGTWWVTSYNRPFCPIHATHRLRLALGLRARNHPKETTR